MLSDVCHDFLSSINDNKVTTENLSTFKDNVIYYSSPKSPIQYEPLLIRLINQTIREFEEQKVNLDRLKLVLGKIVHFLDDPSCPPINELFKELR